MRGRWGRSSRRARIGMVVAGIVGLVGVQPIARGGLIAADSPVCKTRTQPPAVATNSELQASPSNPNPLAHPRLTTWTLQSRAMGRPEKVNVLVPKGFDPDSAARYPVLYLFHGHGGGYRDWVDHLDKLGAPLEDVVDNSALPNLIVVMPDGGYDGFYSDWYGVDVDGHTGASGDSAPAWESFHIGELIPFIDSQYPTINDRSGRLVAGLSMGGFGSTSYPARHPDLFAAAGAFSGSDDSDDMYPLGPIGQTAASNLPDRNEPDFCIWGDPATQQVVWRGHDPAELAGNFGEVSGRKDRFRGVALYLAFGDGLVRPGSAPDPAALGRTFPGHANEQGIYQQNRGFEAALTAAGVPYTERLIPGGYHDWPFWRDDLADYLSSGGVAATAMGEAEAPDRFRCESAESRFSTWGWTFTVSRDVRELVYLSDVDNTSNGRGFSVAGSGDLTVATAGLYEPGASYRIASGDGPPQLVQADDAGRLTFTVSLGPSHEAQQYVFSPPGSPPGTPPPYFAKTQVEISRAADDSLADH